MSITAEKLGVLRQRLQNGSSSLSLQPSELELLLNGFSPDQSAAHRSEVYLVLAAFCEATRHLTTPQRGTQPELSSQVLTNIFAAPVVSRLGDVEEKSVTQGVSFLTALFQVDHESASSIFRRDGVVDCVVDSTELFSSPKFAVEVARLLGQACGHKACREVLPTQAFEWLAAHTRRTADSTLRAAAAIALVKLAKGRSSDNSGLGGAEGEANSKNDQGLAELMKGIVIGGDPSSLADAIEGLAYLSLDPSLKENLSQDPAFLSRLFSLVPSRNRKTSRTSLSTNPAVVYGVVVVISNICSYRPRMTQEAAQIERLKQFVKKPSESTRGPDWSILDDDEHCQERARRLVASGVLNTLTEAIYCTDSDGIRMTVGRAYLSIVEDKNNRGSVLQSGGAKALAMIIQRSLPHLDSSSQAQAVAVGIEALPAIQALAKLAITSSPIQVFGPNEGAMLDAIRPLTLLLLHSSSTLLQRFESMMALTNLSSQSPELASRIAKTKNVMDRVELLLLEDHLLIRRAAMELICNLVAGCDELFEKYSEHARASESKLQIFVALSDVDDLQTRLAASGALATLTTAPTACEVLLELQRKRGRVIPIFTRLINPSSLSPLEGSGFDGGASSDENDLGLVHRGIICTRNFLLNIQDTEKRKQVSAEAESVGLTKALTTVLQDSSMSEAISVPAMVALKWLLESP